MSADRPHDVSYELGGINKQLEMINKTLAEDRMASASYRTDIRSEIGKQRDAINAVGTDIALVKQDMADTKDDISEIKPKVASLEARALMSKGAANFAIIIGKFAHVISAGIGAIIAVLLERWIFGRTP